MIDLQKTNIAFEITNCALERKISSSWLPFESQLYILEKEKKNNHFRSCKLQFYTVDDDVIINRAKKRTNCS